MHLFTSQFKHADNDNRADNSDTAEINFSVANRRSIVYNSPSFNNWNRNTNAMSAW